MITLRPLDLAVIVLYFDIPARTSTEPVRRLNWPRLEVRREWMPGVATLAVPGKYKPWLTIKPGSYSWPELWTKAW